MAKIWEGPGGAVPTALRAAVARRPGAAPWPAWRAGPAELSSARVRIALLAILTLGAGVRFSYLGSTPLRLDEPFSLAIARLPVLEVIRESAASDTHPPLYYLALHGWMGAFGESAFAVRSLSALFGAAVGAVYAIGRMLAGPRVGLLASLLLALSAFHVTYSQEARNYSLLALTAGLSFAFFLKVRKGSARGASAGYVLATAALVYTHVYGLFVVLAQVLLLATGFLAAGRRGAVWRPELRRWAGMLALMSVLYAPWLAVLAVQTSQELEGGTDANLAWLTAPEPRWLPGTLSRYAGSLPVLVLAVTIAAAAALGTVRRGRHAVVRAASDLRALLPATWLATSTVVPFVISVAILPIYQVKYTIAAALRATGRRAGPRALRVRKTSLRLEPEGE